MKHKTIKTLVISLLVLSLSSCITYYKNYPKEMVNKPPTSKPYGKIYYKINPITGLSSSGYESLEEVFMYKSPFTVTEKTDDIPQKGLCVHIVTKDVPPSAFVAVFAYLSYAFFTAIPVLNTQEGYIVVYDLYRDGKKIQSFSYPIGRTVFFWIVNIPFVWINLLTNNASDVFPATAYKFFEDANPYFSGEKVKGGPDITQAITMKDGSVVVGKIISQTKEEVTIQTKYTVMKISKDKIDSIKYQK